MSSVTSSRAGHETARLALARLRLTAADARAAAVKQVGETGARALGVARASVWKLSDADSRLACLGRFYAASDAPADYSEIVAVAPAAFLSAVSERRVLAVANIAADPRVAGLRESGVLGAAVTSLLAAPVIRDGGITGLICLEHEGPPRIWSQGDRDFGASAADMMALFLEQADRLEIEAALRQRREADLQEDKMLALARMSRAVAHDLTNVLGALKMMNASLQSNVPDDLRALADSMRDATGMADRLVQQLSSFGREAAGSRQSVDLVSIVRGMEPVLRRLAQGARFALDLELPAAPVVAEAGELEQIVLNLCVNAVEAVSSGGAIRVEVRPPRPDEPVRPSHIVLSVADDGCGMGEETQAQMFEPYFSRKPSGHGIGLSTVYGIVKRCEGTIHVESAPEAGTLVRVALPSAPPGAIARGGPGPAR
jgi:signal transduction histidine kinase